jgi:hypothetical protein
MKFVCSLIVVEDIGKSKILYEKILKQKIIADFGENVAFEGGFALHNKEHFQMLINGKIITKQSHSFELYFEDDEIERIQKELKLENLEFIHEIKEQPWKQKVVRFYDYDKNIIEIGETMEHVAYRLFLEKTPIDAIVKTTYLSKDKVENAIKHYENLKI